MNCWIGIERKDDRRIVRIVGEFNLAQVPDLLRACDAHEGPVELNLSDLVCADAAGIDTLERLRRQGAVLVGTPGYIQLKLDAVSEGSR